MLEIKTVCHTDPAEFDREVNGWMCAGWQLNKRDADLHSGVFYAELEREVIYAHERDCHNCYYCSQEGGEPCDHCDPETSDKWAPKEGGHRDGLLGGTMMAKTIQYVIRNQNGEYLQGVEINERYSKTGAAPTMGNLHTPCEYTTVWGT